MKRIYSLLLLLFICLISSSCIRFGTMGAPSDRKSIQKSETVDVQLLGGEINTSSREFAPAVNPNGKYIYFSRMTGFLELSIMRGEISGDKVINVQKLDNTVNTEDQNYMGNVSSDGKTLIMCRSHKMAMGVSDPGQGMQDNMIKLNHGIFIYEITNSGYKFVEALDPFKGKLGDGGMPYVTYQTPFISNDKKRVYFSCNPDKMGFGQWDLWYIEKSGSGWSEPVNLGPNVNTRGDESSPFITKDGKMLYFASNGLPGIGDLDIYRSEFINGSWGEAELLGSPISTSSIEQNFTVAPDGKTAYFMSDRSGSGDIYRTSIPVKQVKPVITDTKTGINFTGKVSDSKTGKPIFADIILKNNETGDSKTFQTNSDGKFEIPVNSGKYSIWVQKEGYAFYSSNISVSNKNVDKEVSLIPIESGSKLVLNNITFDFDSDNLKPESETELNKVADILLQNKGFNVEIQGHTDNQGSDDYNKKLSGRRAESVKAYLVKKGVDKKRMSSKGYGPSKPIESNDTEEGRQANRRVEIVFK